MRCTRQEALLFLLRFRSRRIWHGTLGSLGLHMGGVFILCFCFCMHGQFIYAQQLQGKELHNSNYVLYFAIYCTGKTFRPRQGSLPRDYIHPGAHRQREKKPYPCPIRIKTSVPQSTICVPIPSRTITHIHHPSWPTQTHLHPPRMSTRPIRIRRLNSNPMHLSIIRLHAPQEALRTMLILSPPP